MNSALRFDLGVSPWMFDLLTHLWQSTVVAAAILLLMGLVKGLSARTRLTLGWIAVAKFFLPVAWVVALLTQSRGGSESWLASRTFVLPLSVTPVASGDGAARAEIPLAALVWIAVTLGLLACWIVRAVAVRRRLLAMAEPPSEKISRGVTDAAERVGLRRAPRCVIVASEHGPGLVGVFSPVLILPRGLAEELSPPELDAILIHECVHQQRNDNAWSAVRTVFVALLWFNPVAWLLHRAMGIETEKACDERVLEITRDADSYARGIVAAVRHNLGIESAGFCGVTTPPVLSRVRDILAFPSRRERPIVRRLIVIVGLALVGLSGRAGSIAAEAASTPQPARYKVGTVTIKFSATPNVDEQAVLNVMQMRAGVPFDEVMLDRDVRAIYRTGWFKVIEVKHTPVDATTLNLVVEVTPKSADDAADLPPPPSPQAAPAAGQEPASHPISPEDLNDARRKLETARERLKTLQAARADLLAQAKDRNGAMEASAAAAETSGAKPAYDISELDQKPVARFQARPKYPFAMRRARVAGEVVVDFVVNDRGDVINAYALRSSRAEFEAAAVEAVSKWTFRPGVKNGQDVNTHMQVPIVFTLSE